MGEHVFVSYRHAQPDAGYVESLARHLGEAGIAVWFDREMISGDRWDEVIRERVDTCAALVVVMTAGAEASPWVKREIAQAEEGRRPILPLLLAGRRFFRLSDLQYEDVRDGRMPSASFVDRLRALTGGRPATDRVPAPVTPAAEWFVELLRGHTRHVNTVAWSPDGRWLASGGNDLTVRIWDPTDGATVRTLSHDDDVTAVAWSPDGGRLAVGCEDETIRICDPKDGSTVRTLTGHSDWRAAVAWSPDGRRLAAGGREGPRIWDPHTGALVLALTDNTETVAWSPDGRQLAAVGTGYTVRVWDTETGALVRTLTGHVNIVLAVAWSPDGRYIASTGYDQSIQITDAATGVRLRTLLNPPSIVTGLAWSPDGRRLAATESRNAVRIWDPAAGEVLRVLTGHEDRAQSPAWSPDGRHLATASDDRTVRIWMIPP
jgi:dipeptidyl aminopeptidase/acylaminoacyl peptidase